jgi:hypothetical protein
MSSRPNASVAAPASAAQSCASVTSVRCGAVRDDGAAGRGDPLCHLGQRILTPRTQHHGSAGVAEGLRKALTQTRTGASDYRDLSVQAEPVDDRHGWSG